MNLRQCLLSFVAAVFCAAAPLSAAEFESPRDFSIPAQPLSSALMQFAEQSKIQVLTESEVLDGYRSRGIKGKVTAIQALEAILQGTGLSFRKVGEGTVSVRKGGQTDKAPTARETAVRPIEELLLLAQAGPAAAKPQPATEREAQETPEAKEVVVTGSRIRSLLGEQTAQPVLTITRQDIERYGVSSLGEVLQYIPQVSSYEKGQEVNAVGYVGPVSIDVNSNRVTATLRGAPLGGTLLLINGRRAPKNGQAGGLQGNDGYDLGGIPLSAVERIDVLLDGASAIYGADAVGGVINVILREDFRGTEARVNYENTFDTDSGVKTVALTHGFAAGRFSGLLSASWEEANAMQWRDRPFLRTFDRRFVGGPDLRSAASYGYDGAGVISSVSGLLPGLNSSQAAIPAGSTGTNATVASYANAGPLPPAFDYGAWSSYSSEYERKSAAANAQYAFNRYLQVFGEARWGESHTWAAAVPMGAFSVTIPTGAPGNPFGTPIRVTKYFFDLPLPESGVVTENQAATLGFRGELFAGWDYEASAHRTTTRPDLELEFNTLDATRLAQAFAGPNPPNLLYDSTAGVSPNPPGTLEALLVRRAGAERGDTRIYDFHFGGSLFALPAGKVRISAGTEYREENVDFPFPESTLSLRSHDRYTAGYFAEMRIPLVRSLEADLAVRHDEYSDFPSATSPRYSLLYRPFDWLMLRASRGEGYKVPTLVQLYRPVATGRAGFPPGTFLDALRGNESVLSPVNLTLRGNPTLRPEQSENTTAGAVLELPFIEGLSLSFDYYDTRYTDRVGSLALTDRIVLFPQTVIRGPNRVGDLPGWPGPVIGYEEVAFNISSHRISGYDWGVKYHQPNRWGDLMTQITASKTTRNEIRSAPHLPPTNQSLTAALPLQITGSLWWTRGALSTGVLASYRAPYRVTTTTPYPISSATRWDWQGSYDFRGGTDGGSWWNAVLADMKVQLTIFNVLNTRPPLQGASVLPDNTTVDSRLRRYAISVTREF